MRSKTKCKASVLYPQKPVHRDAVTYIRQRLKRNAVEYTALAGNVLSRSLKLVRHQVDGGLRIEL